MFEKLGKFEIKRVLGHGAMGEVYLGTDPAIGREVAIKTILPSAASGGDAKERFAREAKAAGVLNHPNLVTIYEFGEDQGVLYIAMELVKGHDLEELYRDQSLTRSEALEVLAQVCDGLDFAHRNHIVHRDIKPSNVRVSRDGRRLHAKVMDFGVARVGNSDMTATGMVMGTVSYMAPEYIRSGKPDPRSDLFAVGVMLYEALSGRKPFAGDTTPTILYKIVNEPPEPIDTEQLQGISPSIRAVLERALVKDPDQRFQTAADFAKALRSAKDPTWQGQLEEGTALLRTAPPMPAMAPAAAAQTAPAASLPTAAMHMPMPSQALTAGVPTAPRKSKAGLWIGIAALLLAGSGGTAAFLYLRKPEQPAQQAALTPPPPQQEAAPASKGTKGGRPASGGAGLDPARQQGAYAQQQAQQGAFPTNKGAMQAGAPGGLKAATPTGTQNGTQPTPQGTAPSNDKFAQQNLENMEVHERLNLANVTASEGVQLVDKDPAKAEAIFRQAMRANPSDPKAYTWLGIIYGQQKRWDAFVDVVHQAQAHGVAVGQLRQNPRFNSLYQQAVFAGRVS